MKRIIALLCCLVLLCAAVPALADKEDNHISFNGKYSNNLYFSTKAITHAFEAHALGNAPISYKISNEYKSLKCTGVTISEDGILTIPANYIGQFDVIISSAETATYKAAFANISYNVYPIPVDVQAVSTAVGKVSLSWKYNPTIENLKIIINCEDGSYDEIIVGDDKITSYELSNLKPGKKYFFVILTKIELDNHSYFYKAGNLASVIVKQKELVKSFDVLDKTHNIKLKHTFIMKVGQKLQLKVVKVLPRTATVKSFKFRSSNTKIATVNQKGQITALRKGDCYITVNSMDKGGAFKTYRLRVK